jgi:hypothetical protein
MPSGGVGLTNLDKGLAIAAAVAAVAGVAPYILLAFLQRSEPRTVN